MSDPSRQPKTARPDLPLKVSAGITLWCGTIFLAAFTFFSIQAAYLAQVSGREKRVVANVYAQGEWNHGIVYRYKFDLPGLGSFDGDSHAPDGERLIIGLLATVYYDPKHPETNSLINFSQAPTDYFLISIFAFAALAAGIYRARMWRREMIR